MGWFSSLVHKIKNAVKAVVRVIRAVVRVIVKVVVEIVYRVINLLLFWLPIQKKMRIQVMILRDEKGTPLIQPDDPDMQNAINAVIQTYKDKCNIKVIAYGRPVAQIIDKPAPRAALNVGCSKAILNEFGEAGAYFADNLAGWNLIPISLGFPITLFVVRSITDKIGCSLGPLSDYVTVSPVGARDAGFTMAHEIGHCCFLFHRSDSKNLMFPDSPRGNNVTGWQKFVIRGSRHCTFW